MTVPAIELPLIELVAVGLALVYIALASANSPWCWPFAFVSSVLWTYQVWVVYHLAFDAGLNAFYAVMAVVGAWRWLRGGRDDGGAAQNGGERPIVRGGWRQNRWWIIGGLAVSGALGVFAEAYTTVSFPYLDALTTVFSVIGTFLLVERRLENWLYFIVMDALYVYLYWAKGSALFAGLFMAYTLLAVVAYVNWRRLLLERI